MGFGGDLQYAAFKGGGEFGEEAGVAFVAAPPVGGEDAVFGKGAAAVAEEFGAYEAVDDLFAVEAVNQQDVGAAEQGFDVLRAVGFDDFKVFALKGQLEQAAGDGDDLGVDFDDALAGVGQVRVYPAGERAAAEADLGDVCGRVGKQQPAHHGAAV